MRSQLRYVDLDQSGNIRTGRSVEVFVTGTTTPIPNVLYATATSVVPVNPSTMVTDSFGQIELWIDEISAPVDLRLGGASGVTETVYFLPDPSVLTPLYRQGPPGRVYDVEAYGAVGDGLTDDTLAIQACIDAVRTAIGLVPSTYWGATIRFNSFYYAVSALDCSFLHNTCFLGRSGPGGTHLVGTKQTAGVHSSTGKAILDCAATASCSFYNLHFNTSSVSAPNVVPMAGLLFAGTGTLGANCVGNRVYDCGSFGKFQIAPVVLTYSGGHHFIGSGFQQYMKDRPCIVLGDAFPTGHGTLTSLVGDAGDPDPYTFPPATPATGGGGNTFTACEAHHMPASGGETAPYTTGAGYAISIEKSQGLVWNGGFLASYGAAVIRVGGACRALSFRPLTTYSDDPSYRPLYVVGFAAGSTTDAFLYEGGTLDSIPLDSTSGAFVNLAPDATVDKLTFHGFTRGGVPATTCYAVSSGSYSSAATEAIKGESIIECDTLPVNLDVSGTGPSVGTGVTWIDAGTFTLEPTAHNYSPAVQPSCAAIRTTDVSLTSGAFTALSFESATNVTDTMWVIGAPTRVTIKTPGVYDLLAFVRFASNGTGSRYLNIQKNGATTLVDTWLPTSATQVVIVTVSIPGVVLAANDYLELIPSQDSGGGLNVVAAGGGPQLYARRRKE